MSVSDPLLRELKGIVLELRTKNEVVCDRTPTLLKLSKNLEEIFRKGLKNPGWFGKCDYWTWISKLTNISKQRNNPILSMVIDSVKESKKVFSSCGRGRLFIRSALVKKVLAVPVQLLAKDHQLAQEWYTNNSILGDEILVEIFQSLLFELTEVPFQLQIKNASFLDNTWDLATYKKFEFVPCDDLGLHVQLVQGHLLVVSVEPGSVVEEDGKISPGDVLDELYKQPLKNNKIAYAHNLLQKYHGLPVHMGVVKYQDSEGNLYQPIIPLLGECGIDPLSIGGSSSWQDQTNTLNGNRKPPHAILEEEEDTEIPVHGSDGGALYEASYLGHAILGKDGRVQRIEDAVALVLKCNKKQRRVKLDLREKEIYVSDLTEDKLVLQHAYTAISACGRRTDALTYIGYIAGETTCSLAKDFVCHVFEMKNDEEARLALCTMAQGFQRTHLLL
ncbi:uncharacterized protein LOC117333925 isoform X2 [Pecten maximus]|uniref:uncharacterized protein LOC117333925 isoform X1 n=1 Tax=Pecten maximus TaxID=6579 RepID=UPI0014591284|nr:uncharacterized protein LOC117333925 isoform X1 [Pecten maximus]XP_033749247.1 uncharacterized protein LOC117333925 isoform X2 [Pecten maximus]